MKAISTLALVVLLSVPAAAQQGPSLTADSPEGEVYWSLVERQLLNSLASPMDEIREQSLKNAIIFATLYRDRIDLDSAVPLLRQICDGDAASHRRLGLAALQAIGGPKAKAYLARHVDGQSAEESRVLIATILNEHYAAGA